MRILFVCNQGRYRSRSAADMLAEQHETRAKGIYDNLATADDLTWAEVVFCMEDHQRTAIAKEFPKEYLAKKILVLHIPDVYTYRQGTLVRLLEEKFKTIPQL